MGTERIRLVELIDQPEPSTICDDGDPTETRIPVLRTRNRHVEKVLQTRYSGTFTVSIDDKGVVKLFVTGQGSTVVLQPEEAFDLLDLLFEHRDLLASLSAQVAEERYKEQSSSE